ncbi:MAG TPA: glycosyltransferase [Lysobacter sp.]|nr:glycosyltransferase [Lysobacter sp.]
MSIVIPCYNAGELLLEAVNSALAQTYSDIEIIIVDDGSTDARTREILRTHTWPRTRVMVQANAGPAAARNAAIAAARGEFILPLDADDRIHPTYVEKAVAVMRANANVGIVYCKAMRFGQSNGPWALPPYTLRELVIDNVIFVTSLFRKADWEAVGGFRESLRYGIEDYEFWIRIVALGREVVQLDEYLFFYRTQQLSRTSNFQKDRSAMIETYAEVFRNNADFFARHAEYLFEHRFGLYEEIEAYRQRYGKLDAFFQRHPVLRRAAGWLAQLLRLK